MDIKIDDLIEKRKELFKEVEAIDTVLRLFGHKADDYIFDAKQSPNPETSNPKVFPTKTRLDKQILWIFENSISRGTKLKEVQRIFNEHMGNDSINIDSRARIMKTEGKLLVVKYNGKHVHSFWGLPSWIEGNDFKATHKPEEEFLPSDITSSEINNR